MKKYFFVVITFLFLIVSFFLPFGEYNLGYDENEKISLLDALKYLSSARDYVDNVYDSLIIVFAILFLLLAILFLIISLIYAKKNYKALGYISISPILVFVILIPIYCHIMRLAELGLSFIPSWSFYLSLLALLGWVAYIFSPKWLPSLKKAFVGFHSKHPTKSEQINDLQRQIDELKKEKSDNSISSNED